MKKFLLFTILILNFSFLSAQQSMNVTKHSSWDDDSLPGHTYGTFNDIWGYVDENNREYAIMGSAAYIHFFDVTDPENPVVIDQVAGGNQIVWRDFKTYQDRAYCSSDFSGEGLIIFDLSDLPNSVTKIDQTTEFFSRAHNIYIDEANGRLYAAGSNSGDLVILDIATNPDAPSLLGAHQLPNAGYIHDLYVRDNIVYASHGNADKLVIWDLTDPTDPQYIASFESNGYNHSNWVSEDGNTLIFAEEVPTGLPMGIVDISDMENDNIELYTYFKFPLLAPEHEGNTPHNPYILGDYAYTSYYEDGIQIFDISDPANPSLAGYYDTYPENTDYNGYAGCWGVYPFLPSGNILVSDMSNGLFVMEFDEPIVGTNQLPENLNSFNVSPNPTTGLIQVEAKSDSQADVQLTLISITGKIVRDIDLSINGNYSDWLDISDLSSGMYFLSISDENHKTTKKIVKH